MEENLITSIYLTASNAYYHDHLKWCVAKSKQIPLWINLFYFCTDPWVYITFTSEVFVLLFVSYFIQQFELHQWDWNRLFLRGLGSFCQQPCTYKPKNDANRILYLFFIFGCTIFGIIFTAKLLVWATKPFYSEQIQSIDEIIERNFSLAGDGFTLNKLTAQNEVIQIGFDSILWF